MKCEITDELAQYFSNSLSFTSNAMRRSWPATMPLLPAQRTCAPGPSLAALSLGPCQELFIPAYRAWS